MVNRNVALLSFCLALATSGSSLVVFVGGIVGTRLAPAPSLATLPVASMVVGLALFTIPASLLMRRIGRRAGFMLAAGLAAFAAAGAAYAIGAGSFLLFCLAVVFLGGNLAFVQQYRFAAVESVPPASAGRAVSLVLLGGIAAGFLGPELAKRSKDWLGLGEYAGSFAALSLVYLLVLGGLFFFRGSSERVEEDTQEERSLWEILGQPTYAVAVLAALSAYGIMSLIMTATPVHMHVIEEFSLASTGLVIQSHVVAMYLPSLFTGWLVSRLGVTRLMGAGVVALVACVSLILLGDRYPNYWSALVLLGIGWNFLFVGGTVLLSRSYRSEERFKAQAMNDFLVFGVQALASLSAGALVYQIGWAALTALTIPVLILVLSAIVVLRRRLDAGPAPQAAA